MTAARRIRFALERAVFGVLLSAGRILPRAVLIALGARMGDVAYALDRRHRRIALDNLERALGDGIDARERRRIARACWRHFGSILLDTLAFPRFDAASAGTIVRYRGLEHIRAAYASGRGVILFSGHFGHWELVAMMQGHLGIPLSLVTRPLDNRGLETLLARLRGCSGNTIIHKRNAVREMMKVLRTGGGVAIVIDQDARGDGVFVPFFGRPASTTPTLALLALRTGAVVVPVFSVPRADGGYDVTYEAPVEVPATDDRDADVLRWTAECTAIIERWVRHHPEYWLWMHRRWKTRPPGEPATPADGSPR